MRNSCPIRCSTDIRATIRSEQDGSGVVAGVAVAVELGAGVCVEGIAVGAALG
jgi:hypothetical protein